MLVPGHTEDPIERDDLHLLQTGIETHQSSLRIRDPGTSLSVAAQIARISKDRWARRYWKPGNVVLSDPSPLPFEHKDRPVRGGGERNRADQTRDLDRRRIVPVEPQVSLSVAHPDPSSHGGE
jgi:hypothetical protein